MWKGPLRPGGSDIQSLHKAIHGNPSVGSVHIDRALSGMAIKFGNEMDAFVAGNVFPELPVSKQSDVYWEYNSEDFLNDDMRERAPGTESAGTSYRLATNPYFCPIHALHEDISDEQVANEDELLDAFEDSTENLMSKALVNRERRWVDGFFKAGVWTGGGAVDDAARWDTANVDPIQVIRNESRAMLQRVGKKPNVIVFGKQTYDRLLDMDDILSRIEGGATNDNPAIVLRQNLAALFEVDSIYVMEAIYNEAAPGLDKDLAFIGDPRSVLLAYRTPRVGKKMVSAGMTFTWRTLLDLVGRRAPLADVAMKRFRMEHLNATRVEIESSYVQKVISADCGSFFSNTVAP